MRACLIDLVEKKAITQEHADRMREIYDDLVRRYEPTMGSAAAEAAATKEAMKAIDGDILHRRRMALLTKAARLQAIDNIRTMTPEGRPLSARGAQALIAGDDRAGFRNVDRLRTIIRGQAHGMIDGILAKHRKTMLGAVRAKEDLNDLVRELFGESTGNLNARELADAWKRTGEFLRKQFNAAGGRIGRLEGWGLPQVHDSRRIREAGFDAWQAAVVPRLDRTRMVDRVTGQPLADDQLNGMLLDMWTAIATDGWSRREPGAKGIAATANQRAAHRVLHFQTADDWMAYGAEFGSGGSAFDAMMAHIDGMSRDIAAMRVLGPNPAATVDWLGDSLRKSAQEVGNAKDIDGVEAGARQLSRLFDTYNGTMTRSENQRLATWFGSFRAIQTAAKLGSATLSAVSDFGTMIHTARFNRTPIARTVARYGALMVPGNDADRRLAIRLGLVAEEWSNMASAQHRFVGEEMGHEISRRLAEFTMRASFLSAHTQHLRWATGMEHLSHVTQMSDRAFGALDPAFQRALQRYGIGEATWDAIRSTQRREEGGADWIFPEDIADRNAAEALMDFIQSETDMAVPVPDLRTRALTASVGARSPQWLREVAASAFLFKSFPMTIVIQHGRRMWDQEGAWSRARYGLGLMAIMTAGGALSLQLKELANGRDPRPMDGARYWGAAALQGGGLGIFGDLLFSDENRFGGGVGQTLTGPAVQTVSNLKALTLDNLIAWIDGDDKTKANVGKDAMKIVRQEIPVASSLWYTRLAYQRLFADQVQKWIDPAADDAFRRMERRAEQQGTGYWAPPGAASGWRSPDFDVTSNAASVD